MDQQWECLDGNEAAARVAYMVSEVVSIFPITPAAQASACSAIGEAGVIGKIETTSLTIYATRAAASLPSRHSHC